MCLAETPPHPPPFPSPFPPMSSISGNNVVDVGAYATITFCCYRHVVPVAMALLAVLLPLAPPRCPCFSFCGSVVCVCLSPTVWLVPSSVYYTICCPSRNVRWLALCPVFSVSPNSAVLLSAPPRQPINPNHCMRDRGCF